MDTYMDTCEQSNKGNSCKQLKLWWARLDVNQRPDDYQSYQSTYIDYYYLLLIIIIYCIINLLQCQYYCQLLSSMTAYRHLFRNDGHLYGHLIIYSTRAWEQWFFFMGGHMPVKNWWELLTGDDSSFLFHTMSGSHRYRL